MFNTGLGVVPYYGGKRKMARFISELLDYDTTDCYIEPFGGGGSVLLNKPRHIYEVYIRPLRKLSYREIEPINNAG
jgi:site-specific DNA-adenine methylase